MRRKERVLGCEMNKSFLARLIMWFAVLVITSAHQPYVYGKWLNQSVQKTLSSIVCNSTVSQNNPTDHKTITDALRAAPTNSVTKYYIRVKAGVYVERVEVWKNMTNIVLIGDGASSTKVQWNRHAPNYSTSTSGTITIHGDGFVAMFLSFENTAGDVGQAVAAMTMANNVAFYKCTFRSYQDTIYARSGAQFYRECDIYGTVDIICGAAAAVFQSCNLYADKPRTITFTAQSKGAPTPSSPLSGFVIQNCTLTVAPELDSKKDQFKAFLGRPWSNYSTVVVMESYLDSIVQPSGWYDWSSTPKSNLFYRELNNRGPGAATDKRVDWSIDVKGNHEMLQNFTVGEFINKDGWINRTDIPFCNGFMGI